MRDPQFWWREAGGAAALLGPAAALYGVIAGRRLARRGHELPVPVLCVGNFTLGGAGKTPAAIALAQRLMADGERPFFLSRGYGGWLAGPVRVGGHSAQEVGDEPLLLARTAATIVARDRPAGAAVAIGAGASLLIMDDGMQNSSLAKDFVLALVDRRRGVGNGRVFPAGPLRAPLGAQLDRIDGVLVVGTSPAAIVGQAGREAGATAPTGGVLDMARQRGLPVFYGELRPDAHAVAALAGRPVLAFAGIADPEKFFATLEACGIPAAARVPFSDHHRYTAAEAAALLARAERERLTLVTTEKDLCRMDGDPAGAQLAARTAVLPVVMEFASGDTLAAAISQAINRRRGQ